MMLFHQVNEVQLLKILLKNFWKKIKALSPPLRNPMELQTSFPQRKRWLTNLYKQKFNLSLHKGYYYCPECSKQNNLKLHGFKTQQGLLIHIPLGHNITNENFKRIRYLVRRYDLTEKTVDFITYCWDRGYLYWGGTPKKELLN